MIEEVRVSKHSYEPFGYYVEIRMTNLGWVSVKSLLSLEDANRIAKMYLNN